MTPLDLQALTVEELKQLFDGWLFPKMPPHGQAYSGETVPLNLFKQTLPKDDSGDPTAYMPYIIVQVQNGKQDSETESGDVTVALQIGIFDEGRENQGHAHVLNIIETIHQHFFKTRTLGDKYFITLPFEWAVNDEDLWPAFIGAIETHWNMPVIQPTDPTL